MLSAELNYHRKRKADVGAYAGADAKADAGANCGADEEPTVEPMRSRCKSRRRSRRGSRRGIDAEADLVRKQLISLAEPRASRTVHQNRTSGKRSDIGLKE